MLTPQGDLAGRHPGPPNRTSPTRLPVRVLFAAIVLAGLFLLTFAWWGDSLERLFRHDEFAAEMARMKSAGWLLGVSLLVSDILLPVPATGIMAALGAVYGFWLGWLFGAIGSVLAGLAGYGLVRLGRDRVACLLASPEELQEFRGLFARWGALAVIGSRALPVLPEVMAVLAGLARMRLRTFVGALLAGSLPVSALYAGWGCYAGVEAPVAAFFVAVVVPLVLWAVCGLVLRRQRRGGERR